MLILDDREHGILEPLKRLGMDVYVARLDSADCRFTGNGPNGECLVGCERKKLSDLVACIKDRRLSGEQLRKLAQDHDFAYIIAEGMWRPTKNGLIEQWVTRRGETGWQPFYAESDRKAVSFRQVFCYLTTLELKAQELRPGFELRVQRAQTTEETAHQYAALWHWFNGKSWAEHRSHDQVYSPTPTSTQTGPFGIGAGRMPGWCWSALAQYPGLDRRAEDVAKHFGSIKKMALAKEYEWKMVRSNGRRLPKPVIEACMKATVDEQLYRPRR